MPEWVRISFRPNDEDTLWQSTLVSAQTPPIKKGYLQTENLPESKNIYMQGQEQYYFLYYSVWPLWTARNSWRRWLYYPPGSLPRPVVCPRAIETDLQSDSAPAVYPEIFPCYPKHLISIKQNDQGTHYTYRLGKYCCNGSSGSINCIDLPSIFPWVKSAFFLSNVYHPFMFCVYCVSKDLFAFPLIWNCEYKL